MKFINLFAMLGFLLILNSSLLGQEKYCKAIEDNSFFIEEAYNQEPGVVQHIFNGLYFNKPTKDLELSFTQEWPVFSQRHQLSYTIPYNSINSGNPSGLGDIMIHYRYMALTCDDWITFAPRFSLILPIGNKDKGLGSGTLGYEINLPFSKRLSDQFVTHINAGITLIPSITETIDDKEYKTTYTSFFGGISLIYLATRELNIMLEALHTYEKESSDDLTFDNNETIISPGLRYLIPIESLDLEIVPGFALPISINKDETRLGFFFYLSFEHSF